MHTYQIVFSKFFRLVKTFRIMGEQPQDESIALAVQNFGVQDTANDKMLLSNVTAYVRERCITAVLGASAAGKSVLLQALAGHLTDLKMHGNVVMSGEKVNPRHLDNPIAYVSQDDMLIGELTAREVTENTAYLKRDEPVEKIKKDVDDLLTKLGLGHVADGIIGTLIFRGLSGGQKRRVQMAAELIAAPSILLLDEPTSGLDSSAAYEALSCIRDMVKDKSRPRLSVILTIHQPNSKLLELFDDIMLLDKGEMTFFGTLPKALQHFETCGFPCPDTITPTDYFLQVSDSNFTAPGAEPFNFKMAFRTSHTGETLAAIVDKHVDSASTTRSDFSAVNHVPMWKQIYTLVYREYTIAYRDPTLYYFQVALLTAFALMCGAVFWNLPREVNGNFNIFPSALLWLVLMNCWIHSFKVFYLSTSNKRASFEISNGKYSPLTVVIADILATSSLVLLFFPVGAIAYFMMGFPTDAFPFVALALWVASLAGEAMIAALTKLTKNATTAMVFAMISLVTLEVFGGGVFIPWDDCPDYWLWLQEITVFAQSTRAINMEVLSHMSFTCVLTNGVCIEPGTGVQYACASYNDALPPTTCEVSGREMMMITQGIGVDDSYWKYFMILVAIYICLKCIVVFFTYVPAERAIYRIGRYCCPQTAAALRANSAAHATAEAFPTKATVSSPSALSSTTAGENTEAKVTTALSWTDFSITLPKTGKKLVEKVNGYVRSGTILALMGPSGAGKTTLLNGLANRASYARVEGDVKFANRTVTPVDLTYVPQFDEINDVMSAHEHIMLVGKLTCSDQSQMSVRVEEILEVLGLTAKRNVPVRFLSGGEIKRCSIGVGLISNPKVLFLDEPTTGLDSTAAYSIVNYLSKMTRKTKVAVIMTIHQPSALVFEMLDDLFLMEKGRLVYGGSIANSGAYFSTLGMNNPHSINPADYYLDLVQLDPLIRNVPNATADTTWTMLFKASSDGERYEQAIQALKNDTTSGNGAYNEPHVAPGMMGRYITMVLHFFSYFLAEPGYFIHRVFALLMISLMLGTLFYNLNPYTLELNSYVGAIFSTAIAVMLCAVASTALFARDRREAVDRIQNGFYQPGVFVAAQFTVSTVYNFFAVLIFTLIFHWLADLNPAMASFYYDVLVSWGHICCMEGMLMILIEVLKNEFLSTSAGMIFLGTNMLFAGFFRLPDEMPVVISWMCYVVPLHWSFNGFTWQIFQNQNFTVSGSNPAQTVTGKYILDSVFDLTNVNSYLMLGILFIYVVMFRVIQYFLLAWQTESLPWQGVATALKPSSATPISAAADTDIEIAETRSPMQQK